VRVAFAGTPQFALPSLNALIRSNCEIAAVYTQPDRPSGRGRDLVFSPVKQAALAAGLAVYQPAGLKSDEAQVPLGALALDLLVVVAYGVILPQAVLDMPRYGCWNVHGSLLPRWRGAAPIQRAIEAGDAQTGVALMQMDAGLDTGAVLDEAAIALDPRWNAAELGDKLAQLGADLLATNVSRLLAGVRLNPLPQPSEGATYARKLSKEEALLDFNLPAATLLRKIKAFNPAPVCSAKLGALELRIFDAAIAPQSTAAAPGTLLKAAHGELWVSTGEGVLALTEVQRAGGKRLAVKDFLNAKPQF